MTTAAPDWSVTAETVQCPLCDYNLRGLTQPLCPECGYTFAWPDLLDPRRRRHQYLFEHNPRRNLASFAKTITRKFRPGRFWKTLYPSQPVNTRRLITYGLICALVAFLPAILAMLAVDSSLRLASSSAPVSIVWSGANWPPTPAPAPASATMMWWDRVSYLLWEHRDLQIYLGACAAAYPLLSGLIFLIFHQSMRRASVKPRHAMRVALYSGDIVFWYGLWALGLIAPGSSDPFAYDTYERLLIGGALVAMSISFLRMWAGCRYYMQFRDAFGTVVAAQLIALLALLCFMPLSMCADLYRAML
jgi:hypothetical protein